MADGQQVDPDMAALYEWMAQAEQENPGSLQKMLDAALYGDRMGVEGDTMKMGADLWNTPSAKGQNVGQTYVASSPLEHLSVALQRGLGASKLNQSQATQQGLINQKGTGLEALIKAMMQHGQPQIPSYDGEGF
jgi:hypothetical protein